MSIAAGQGLAIVKERPHIDIEKTSSGLQKRERRATPPGFNLPNVVPGVIELIGQFLQGKANRPFLSSRSLPPTAICSPLPLVPVYEPVSAFGYREQWDFGDIITVHNRQWGLERALRIVEVTRTVEPKSGYTRVEIALGAPWDTLRDRILRSQANLGAVSRV